MMTRRMTFIPTIGVTLVLLCSGHGRAGGQQDALSILNGLPPDLYAKVQILAHMIDQSIKAGTLTDAEVQQGMISGHLGDTLKAVNPEADHLLDEISDAIKSSTGLGGESLLPLLGGLGISPQ